MKYNEETKKVLVRSGLGWLIPLLPEGGVREFKVELIDLDSLSIGPDGYECWGEFVGVERVFLFDKAGCQIAEVGGKRTEMRLRWCFSLRKWPPIFRGKREHAECVFETVEMALGRLGKNEIDAIRYIVTIPRFSCGELMIRKLKNSDLSLSARLEKKADEAVAVVESILAG